MSFECDDIDHMYLYLKEHGITIIQEPQIDNAGNWNLLVKSPSNYLIEYIKYMPNSLHHKSKGKYLSEERISKRIHHAGLHVKSVKENDMLYRHILDFKPMWRYNESDEAKPNYIYLHMPDCVENIEYIVTDDIYSSHPCLLLDDMQTAIYKLKERANGEQINKPIIGKGNRWLLNLKNSDGLRIEFTEAYTVR